MLKNIMKNNYLISTLSMTWKYSHFIFWIVSFDLTHCIKAILWLFVTNLHQQWNCLMRFLIYTNKVQKQWKTKRFTSGRKRLYLYLLFIMNMIKLLVYFSAAMKENFYRKWLSYSDRDYIVVFCFVDIELWIFCNNIYRHLF